MRRFINIVMSGLIAIIILLTGIETLAQSANSLASPLSNTPITQQYRMSEGTASRLSALGTIVPVGIGFVLAATQSGREHQYTDYGGYPYTYYDDPDQTLPALLISSGIVFGPSLGYFYAGKPGRGFAGIGFRTAIGFGALIGAIATCPWSCGPGDGAYDAAWGIMIIGGALVAGSAIYDISKVDNVVRAQNEKHSNPKLSVLPDYFPGHKALGLRAKLTF